jgi:hypothetical protein
MAVWEQENEYGGAPGEWAFIPLRWWRFVCAETSESLLVKVLEDRLESSVGKVWGAGQVERWFRFVGRKAANLQ